MDSPPSLFDRLVRELGYAESGGLLRVGDRADSGAREMVLARVRRHLPDISAVYFAGDVPLVYFSVRTRADRSDVADLHKRVWNDSRVPLLFVIDPGYVSVYDAWAVPTDDPNLIDDERRLIRRLTVLDHLLASLEELQRPYLDTGEYADRLAHRFKASGRCDAVLLDNLAVTRARLIARGLQEEAADSLLIRSILILHLEDRGILKPDYYRRFRGDAEKLTDLYSHRNIAYDVFANLAERFNGDLLPVDPSETAVDQGHLSLLRDFLEGGVDVETGQRMLWPLYDFSVIPIQLISSMYELLLHSKDPSAAKKLGAYYTPYQLTELMVNEILPWPSHEHDSLPPKIRVIDPTCGSGVFLVEIFRRLAAYARKGGKALDCCALSELLHSSVFGIDANPLAVRVAAFSLCLAVLDEVDEGEGRDVLRFPQLRTAPAGGTPNLITGDAFSHASDLKITFDFVVGNPPWKRGKLPAHVANWLESRGYPAAGEIAQAFMWLARELAPEGRVTMLSPSKWLFNREAPDVQFRRSFFERNYVEVVINLSALVSGANRLFKANAPATGVVFKPRRPEPANSPILYCTPRPSYRAAVPTALLIDGGDLKWLPRKEAERDDLVWKATYAGSWRDFRLLKRLSGSYEAPEEPPAEQSAVAPPRHPPGPRQTLETFITSRPGWASSRGFQAGGEKSSPEIVSKPFVAAEVVLRYFIPDLGLFPAWSPDGFKRTGDVQVYEGPHVLIKEGTQGGRLWAAFTPADCTFKDTITGIRAPKGDESLLKALVAYLNSSLASYYLFMTTGWGIDRKRVKKGEALSLPAAPLNEQGSVTRLSALHDEMAASPGKEEVQAQIDALICKAFSVTKSEQVLVRDMVATGIGYVHRAARQRSILPPTKGALEAYVKGFSSVFGPMLAAGGRGLAATIYNGTSPLRLVSFRILDSQPAGRETSIKESKELNDVLRSLDERLMRPEGLNLFRRRHGRVFEGQAVHIIKPAEARFWTQSAGLHDADETIALTLAGKANGIS